MPCSCRSQVDPFLDQVAGSVASFTGDGAYDHDRVYAGVAERHPEAAVVVPPRSIAVPSEMAETAPTQRDGHLQHIAKHGRMAWQNASGYNKRARVEATMGRWKQVRLLLDSGVVRPGRGSCAASIWCASKSGSS